MNAGKADGRGHKKIPLLLERDFLCIYRDADGIRFYGSYFAYDTARVSRITVIFTWPG